LTRIVRTVGWPYLLKLLLTKYPDAEQANDARQLQTALERITQAPAG